MTSSEILEEKLFVKQRYCRLENQKQWLVLAHNHNFATGRGLKPKVKSVNVKMGKRIEQTSLTQTYQRRRFGGKALSR